jgi:hypothetical protein
MLLTRFAHRRRLALWLHNARVWAERLRAHADRLVAAGAYDAAFRFGRAAWRALVYAQRVGEALARLGGRP